jgi:hypothetical protein
VVALLSVAGPATAGPRGIDIPIPFDPTGGLSGVSDACNNLDAPMPASPYGDGSFIVRMTALGAASKAGTQLNDPEEINNELDPFRNKDEVSLESAYGTSPQWWTYDNGCTGGDLDRQHHVGDLGDLAELVACVVERGDRGELVPQGAG